MNPSTRYFLGLLLLLTIQVLFVGTVVYLVRRSHHAAPARSWSKTLGAFFLLGLVVAGVGLLPVIGGVAAVIVSLVGLKRLSGLDVLGTFVLSFCLGISVFLVAGVLSNQLGVDLLGLRN